MTDDAERALALLPPHELRAAITRLSVLTPEVLYGSDDFDPDAPEKQELRGIGTALLLIASRGHEDVKPNDTITLTFTRLTTRDVPYGDWQVSITQVGEPSNTIASSDITLHEKELSKCPPKALRSVLSRLSALTPFSLYPTPGFGAEQTEKTVGATGRLGPAGQAGMFLCSQLKGILKPGETWRKDMFTMERDTCLSRAWHIDVTRYSL